MSSKQQGLRSLVTALLLGGGGPLSAEAPPKKITGALEITIRVKTVLPPQRVQVIADSEKCGVERTEKSFQVDDQKNLHYAAVWLVSDRTGGEGQFNTKNEIVLEKCDSSPRVLVVRPGEFVHISNHDSFLYHLHSISRRNPPSVFVLPPNLKETKTKFDQPEIVKIVGDIHPWVKIFVVVASSPLYSITNGKGEARFEHLEPGSYKVHLWHELLGEKILEDSIVVTGKTEKRTIEWD